MAALNVWCSLVSPRTYSIAVYSKDVVVSITWLISTIAVKPVGLRRISFVSDASATSTFLFEDILVTTSAETVSLLVVVDFSISRHFFPLSSSVVDALGAV